MRKTVVSTLLSLYLRLRGAASIIISRKAYRKCREYGANHACELLHCIASEVVKGSFVIIKRRNALQGIPVALCGGVMLCLERKMGYVESCYAVLRSNELASLNDYYEVMDSEKMRELLHVPPYIIIDLTLYELHREGERGELFKQLVLLIDAVRSFLTELNVVLFNAPKVVVDKLFREFNSRITAIESGPNMDAKCRDLIVLDPYAEETLREDEVLNADCFVLGGIVDDKTPRPYATTLLRATNWRNSKSRKVELWGSKVGVPNRINKIVELILRVRFEDTDLEHAVLESMSKRDKLVRAHREAYAVYSSRGVLPRSFVERLAKMLSLSVDEIIYYLATRGIKVEEE